MQCRYCGQNIDSDARFCHNCGHAINQEMVGADNDQKFWKQGWFAALLLFVFWPVGLYLLWKYHGKIGKPLVIIFGVIILMSFITAVRSTFRREDKTDNFVEATQALIVTSQPSQEKFNEIQVRYNQNKNRSKTQLEEVEFNKAYEKEFNDYLKDGYVKNWCAEVYEIESVNDGKAAYVRLYCDFPNARYDIQTARYSSKNTLIAADSVLYKKIIPLKRGDVVVISGKLVASDYSEKVINMTKGYGDKNEKLNIEFSDIQKVNTGNASASN